MVPAVSAPGAPPREVPQPSAFERRIIDEALRSDVVFWLAENLVPADMIETLLATPPRDVLRAAPEEQQRVREVLHRILPIGDRAAGLQLDGRPPTPIDPAELAALYGTAAGARFLAGNIPGARLVVYPDGGHLVVGHQVEAWNAIEQFLRSLPQESPALP
jgi:pimeloyl-ACP methyl ester carboxylesterase